ncbi:unnamed protein product [Mytilus edulis]|uniref:SEA domain-containing protein n=1 Tax=Mytilus edulis TaxID=6550 RepID=A0A8S3RUN9_MYTED|nr:unnamed protein product [Mytilus edulis]
MAGRSQHRDNRSSYFSSDIGRSGVYDGVNGTPINFSQRGDNPNDLRDTEGISETARESGLYASRIGSTKQPTEDYSKEGMLGSTGNFPRQNWDQSFEEGNRTPESGTYSRNIESNQYDTDYKANNDIGRRSTFDNNRDSGLYSRKIGSFRETIPDKDMATPFPENSGKDNQRQSSKHFKPNKYIGNTLDTMLEGEDESKQPEHFHSTNYSESRKYSGTARNGDYDGHSNASFQDDKEFPPWAGMMVEQQFTDKYIKTKWPRISLHLTQPRHSDPFVPGKIDEGSIDINSAKDDHKTRNTLCVIGLGTLLLCLVGAAIITVIVLANQSTDKTEYVTVNMTITVEKTFTSELNNPKSTDYKLFASEVCKQTKDVYTSANSSLSGYYGCKVSNMENGSIIVTYIIYFTGTTTQQVTPEAVKTILDSHLNVSSSQLGDLVIVTGSVTVNKVETETLSSPPPVEESVTTTTTVITTPHIETTTEVVVPSTVTTSDSETVQTTEATTLNTKQTTMETTSLTTSSTEAKTPKTVQTTTETVISTVPPTEDTTTEPKQSTMETTTSKVPTSEDTTTEPKQSTMETTTSTVPPTEDTTTETVQSTTASTPPLISSTEETTLKTVQSTGKTNTPSVSLTDETTPKTMHSTTKIITPSSSSTENTTPKTMQTETTSPIMISTVESMSSQSTNHVSDVPTTLQTEKTTEDTTTSDSTERTKTSSSLPFIDTTKPVISTSTDDTNQLITSPTTEDTTKLITSTPPDETTRLITSTSTEDTTSKMPSTSMDYTTHAEDTTKPTTSASTEESTTKLITPTSIDDTTKPVTFTSTDDTTATLTSTATVDTTKSVTSTPIEDVTQSETFTSTEKTTKHVTSTPSEDTTKTISSAPTEDTTPSITAISTEDTPTEDTTTKTVSSIITEGTTLSITATSTSMPTTGRTTSDEITTVSGNICSCAVSGSYRAHPSNCRVKVLCIEDGGIMYPTGFHVHPTNAVIVLQENVQQTALMQYVRKQFHQSVYLISKQFHILAINSSREQHSLDKAMGDFDLKKGEANPGKPTIGQQIHTIEGQTVKYTCTGNVGNPPGSIEFSCS